MMAARMALLSTRVFSCKDATRCVRHPANQGLGMAIRTGLMAAQRLPPRTTLSFLWTPMLRALAMDRVASAFPCIGAFERRCFFLIPNRISDSGSRDFTCGFRTYRASAIQRASQTYGSVLFEFDGFQSTVDLLLKLRKIGVHFAEVPIVLRYDQKRGLSKMRVFQTAIRTLGLMMRRRLGRWDGGRMGTD